jgi:hypothetical protein
MQVAHNIDRVWVQGLLLGCAVSASCSTGDMCRHETVSNASCCQQSSLQLCVLLGMCCCQLLRGMMPCHCATRNLRVVQLAVSVSATTLACDRMYAFAHCASGPFVGRLEPFTEWRSTESVFGLLPLLFARHGVFLFWC